MQLANSFPNIINIMAKLVYQLIYTPFKHNTYGYFYYMIENKSQPTAIIMNAQKAKVIAFVLQSTNPVMV